MTNFYESFVTQYNLNTGSNIPVYTNQKALAKIISQVRHCGNAYNFTFEDYINCINYCYEVNPLNFSNLKEYGKISNYLKVMPIYIKNKSTYKAGSTVLNTEMDNKWFGI
jgi:hypothetical protein